MSAIETKHSEEVNIFEENNGIEKNNGDKENTNEEKFESEIYAVDTANNFIVYGGNRGEIIIQELSTMEIIKTFPRFNDSIIYIKIFNEGKNFYVVSLDGKISIYDFEKEIETTDIEEDITSYSYTNFENKDYLVIGTKSGLVYNFFQGVGYYKCFYGHTEDVTQAEFFDGQIFSISSSQFLIFDAKTGTKDYGFHSYMMTFFHLISSSVFVIASQKNVRIYKHDRLLKKIDESDVCTFGRSENNKILCGGGKKFFEINFGQKISQYDFEEVRRISNIKVKDYLFICSSEDMFGIGDVRKGIETFIDSGIGIIFDFVIGNGFVILAGEKGITLVDLSN